jgi:hypothetical protein
VRYNLAAWAMLPILWDQACWAQSPTAPVEPDDLEPTSTNVPGSQYPQISSAPQARFRIYASDAQSVHYESPGTAHEWPTWRRYPREFAPLLLKDPRRMP